MSAPLVDAYGFRGQDPRVLFLCPFEFFMYWEIKRVPEPYRDDCEKWSSWTEEGKEYYDKDKHAYNFKLIPGKHYKVTAQYVTTSHAHRRARIRALRRERSIVSWLAFLLHGDERARVGVRA